MSNRTSLSVSLLLLLLVVNGCSTNSGGETNHNANITNTNNARTNSDAKTRQDSTELRNAVIDCLKRTGSNQEVRGIVVADYIGEMLACCIVAADTGGKTLTYFAVYSLEDKNGTEYSYAELLNGGGVSGYVVDLMYGKKHLESKD